MAYGPTTHSAKFLAGGCISPWFIHQLCTAFWLKAPDPVRFVKLSSLNLSTESPSQ
jgi:hypothetical protein